MGGLKEMKYPHAVAAVVAALALAVALAPSRAQDAEALKGDIERGLDVFEGQCYDCHNADSKVYKSGPGFKDISKGKLPSGKDATRENVLAVINQGFEGGQMPAFNDVLTAQEKEDVTAYVLSR
jgi:mono/diheme cytochrome c family protein